jgi:hypothetical protein
VPKVEGTRTSCRNTKQSSFGHGPRIGRLDPVGVKRCGTRIESALKVPEENKGEKQVQITYEIGGINSNNAQFEALSGALSADSDGPGSVLLASEPITSTSDQRLTHAIASPFCTIRSRV